MVDEALLFWPLRNMRMVAHRCARDRTLSRVVRVVWLVNVEQFSIRVHSRENHQKSVTTCVCYHRMSSVRGLRGDKFEFLVKVKHSTESWRYLVAQRTIFISSHSG